MSRNRCVACLTLVVALLAAASAEAIVIRSDRPDSDYLSLAARPEYASVGRIGGPGFSASGTLIAPNWVLTAGHVVDNSRTMNFTIGGRTYTSDRLVANPAWNGNVSGGFDIGLVHLSTAVAGITPAKLYTGSMERGMTATTVGFGTTGTGTTGGTKFDGRKRAATNVIDTLLNSRIFMMDFDNPTRPADNYLGSSTPTGLEGLIAPGDSGGGVFITTSAGTFLAGVNSFGSARDGKIDFDYGDISGHTRVSSFASWIKAVTAGSASSIPSSGGGSTIVIPSRVGVVPEPATWTLLAVGLAAAGLLRLRRARR